jgi:hypothetical protein
MRAMSTRPALGGALVATVLLPLTLALARPTTAHATTGPTQFLGLSKYHVPMKIAHLWTGQYLIVQPQTAHLSGASLGIEITPYGFLHGIGQFYGYDAHGRQTSWVSTIYNFHLTAHSVMVADVMAQMSSALLGRLFLTRQQSGDLVGQIALAPAMVPQPIHWHRVNGGSPGG